MQESSQTCHCNIDNKVVVFIVKLKLFRVIILFVRINIEKVTQFDILIFQFVKEFWVLFL